MAAVGGAPRLESAAVSRGMGQNAAPAFRAPEPRIGHPVSKTSRGFHGDRLGKDSLARTSLEGPAERRSRGVELVRAQGAASPVASSKVVILAKNIQNATRIEHGLNTDFFRAGGRPRKLSGEIPIIQNRQQP